MLSDRAALLKAVEADPRNDLLRNVFADYLEEHGEEEEGDRQRKWCATYARMEKLLEGHMSADREERRRWLDEWRNENAPTEQQYRTMPIWQYGKHQITPEEVIEAVKENGYYTQLDDETLRDDVNPNEDLVAEFWECYEIMTGEWPDLEPDDLATPFSCSC